MNEARADAGLLPLPVAVEWREDARDHSDRMAIEQRLFHDMADAQADAGDVSACWSRIGENVGKGTVPVEAVHRAFLASPGHRANILGEFAVVGIGVERAPDGTIWVTERFMQLQPGCPVPAAL